MKSQNKNLIKILDGKRKIKLEKNFIKRKNQKNIKIKKYNKFLYRGKKYFKKINKLIKNNKHLTMKFLKMIVMIFLMNFKVKLLN